MTRASKGEPKRTFPYNKLEQVVIGLVVGKHRAVSKLPCQPAVSEHGQHPPLLILPTCFRVHVLCC